MRKLLLPLLLLMSSCQPVFADLISYPTTWGNGDTVTATKLNNNNNAVSSVVNGALDNTNTKTGYSLFQTVSALPTAGTQGRVDFLTSDNSLNLDTGAAWVKTITPSGTPQTGSISYYNGGWQLLNPGAQYYSLMSNGTSSLPSYQQVNLTNGITGNLPVTNLNSGTNASASTYWRGDSTWGSITTGNQLFKTSGTFTAPTAVTTVYLTMLGGGGAGGGGNASSGGGGGGGAYLIGIPYTVIPGNPYTVTVGAGGIGVLNGTGGTGGTTSFDGTISVLGGSGGLTTGNGGAGAVGVSANASATVATASTVGGGYITFSGGNGAKNAGNNSGAGGGTAFGIGAAGLTTNGTDGIAASANSGGGGSGSSGPSDPGGTTRTGGAGGSGFVLVQY